MTALLIRYWPHIAIVAALIAAILWVDARGYQRGSSDVRAEWDAANAKALEANRAQERKNAAETERRYAAQMEAANAKEKELEIARRDAASATAAGERLRAEIGRLTTARAASHPGAVGGSAPASTALDLLPDVQRRLDEAADGIARHADEASAAGRACERSYDALIGGKE